MKNTSQKSILRYENTFREIFFSDFSRKKNKKIMIFSKVYETILFQNPHEKIFKNNIMTREIVKKIFEIFGIILQKTRNTQMSLERKLSEILL